MVGDRHSHREMSKDLVHIQPHTPASTNTTSAIKHRDNKVC